ncbi:MAG: HlyD family efflux transporter periplasmic adaptor subunit [Desertifilum sp. SIO1I2]|nr:HlyD family efflux transporter periplasmic adaptor subunit [Desertifilum sp. SIO1I2]
MRARAEQYSETYFEQPVLLERPVIWSQILVWLIMGVTTSALVWAAVAQIEQAVPAVGKLEPEGSVVEIKTPTSGVVEAIHVKDGETVKQGDLLVTFDPTTSDADVDSLTRLREVYEKESQFYGEQVDGVASNPSDLAALVRLKDTLLAENEFYNAQLNGFSASATPSGAFAENQRRLLDAARDEYNTRVQAAQLKISELDKQLRQVEDQISATTERLSTSERTLALNEGILDRISPLVTEGALSQLQMDRQEQEVLSRQDEVMSREAELGRLQLEAQRIRVEMAKAQEEVANTRAISAKDVLSRIADNQKRIAEIDTQLSRSRLDNEKRLAELDAQLVKARQAQDYRDLKAPADGVVFNLQVRKPGYVAQATDTLLSIVPNENLVAQVYLQNKDIGFVREGMPVEVNVSSFPSSEFGTINGELIWIGSDVLAPTQVRPYYAFPAKIKLDRQEFVVNGKELRLQSGMEITANVKVRKRSVLSLFTDWFDKKTRGLETVR